MAKPATAPVSIYKWNLLPDSPAASSRTDDIWFFDENVGWLINSSGYVAKTDDGGQFWHQKYFVYPGLPSRPYLRSMSWGSRKVGWFGSVTGLFPANDPSKYLNTLLYQTKDGGETWNPVLNLPKGSPAGICGFHAVSELVAYGSGTNDPGLPGPGIIKTTDGGANWTLIPMEKHADNLIDIYFFDENNGFVVGGKNVATCPTNNPAYPAPRFSRYGQLVPVVLRTSDGGKTWTNTAAKTKGLPCGEWGWKIQFLNKKIGFIALENFRDAAILKTTDGGESWVRKHVAASQENMPPINNDLEGIGFIDEKTGWVGGWGDDFNGYFNSFTQDGGETWIREDYNPDNPAAGDPRYRINRYRFIGKPVAAGYCCGQQIFKLSASHKKAVFGKKTVFGALTEFKLSKEPRHEPAHSGQIYNSTAHEQPAGPSLDTLPGFEISQKPTQQGEIEISYTLPADTPNVFIGLWNKFAFHVRTLINEKSQSSGRQTVIWDGKDDDGNPVGNGVFICRICVDGEVGDSQMILLQGAV
jgi:photosystem II stability/assembly factor-like uncharacterized protein